MDVRRRNQIAQDIFAAEQLLGRDHVLPWEQYGVPIGLVGFNRQWKPLFFDRNAVVRQGGGWRERTTVIQGPSRSLASARFRQFVEQIAEAGIEDPRQLACELRWLPTVDILPRLVRHPARQ
jgi:hypothetical protein